MKKLVNIVKCSTFQLAVYILCGTLMGAIGAYLYVRYHNIDALCCLVGYILFTILLPPMQAFSDVFFSGCTNFPRIFEEGIFSTETPMFFGNRREPVKTSDFVAKSYAECHVFMTVGSLLLIAVMAASWVMKLLGM